MSRPMSETLRSQRIELRVAPAEKALLVRAAALSRLDLSSFMMRAALPEARSLVDIDARIALSERDSLRVLELLENPPSPSPRLIAAARGRLERA